jgi:adenine phosphoribosyltransferase
MKEIADLIRAVPDFPIEGVTFRDITPLLLESPVLQRVVDHLAEVYSRQGIDRVAAIESRGFIFGVPLALKLGCGFVPIRRLGKLPRRTVSRAYALEYGSNHLEIHVDAVQRGHRVLVIDDVLATGGTARAAIDLVEELGGEVVGAAFLIELPTLGGRAALAGHPVLSLLSY